MMILTSSRFGTNDPRGDFASFRPLSGDASRKTGLRDAIVASRRGRGRRENA
jgi:hypothetical protein